MATLDPRMTGPPPHMQGMAYPPASSRTTTAPIPIPMPQPRAYQTPSASRPTAANDVRPQDGYLPQSSLPKNSYSATGSYPGTLPQVAASFPTQTYQSQPPASYVPVPQPVQYSQPPPNGAAYPIAPESAQQQQQLHPTPSHSRRPRVDSQRSSFSARSEASPSRPGTHSGSYQTTWLPTTYEHEQAQHGRRSSYDYAPYHTFSHEPSSRRDRRASYTYRREHAYDDRYDRDYSSDSRSSTDRERRRRKSKKNRANKDTDKMPTLADSTLWAWDHLKEAIRGR